MTHNDLHYEFGPYQLDPSNRTLTRNGAGIPFTLKATEILLVLLKHAGQLVEKDEPLKEVWPDTFVEEANLSQNNFTLRRALGDERTGPKHIETVARRGYRFIQSGKTIREQTITLAGEAIDRAVRTLELTDGEADLAESLTTAGVVAVRQCRYGEAGGIFEAAFRVAERYGDHEGAGRALLIMFEEMNDGLGQRARGEKCVALVHGESHKTYEQQ